MKRKIIIPILSVFAILSSNAYAATPVYNPNDNSVGFAADQEYQTVLITKDDEQKDIVYIGQNDSGYGTAMEDFLIKNNPEDGQYLLKAAGFGSLVANETFSIATHYIVTATVDEHVKEVALKPLNNQEAEPYPGTINRETNTATFFVPKGTYTVLADCENGYHLKNAQMANVTIDTDITTIPYEIESEQDSAPRYDVAINIDGHVQSIKIKQNGTDVQTISFFPNNSAVCRLEMGEYTIEVTPDDGYELAKDAVTMFEVTTDGATVNITTEEIKYTVTVNIDANVASVTLMPAEGGMPVTGMVADDNLSVIFTVPEGTYTVSAMPKPNFKIDECPESITVNKDNKEPQISVTTVAQENPVYTVSGTADENVTAVIIKKVGETVPVATIIEFGEDYSFSYDQLESGDYTIEIITTESFELDTITNNGEFTITDADVIGIVIATKEKLPQVPVTRTTIATDDAANETVLTTRLFNITGERTCIAAAYDDGGNLIAIKLDTTQESSVSFRFPNKENIKSYRVLVWNSIEKMEPITDAEPVK